MDFTIHYTERAPLRTISLEAELTLRDVTAAASRLRSWAMTRDVAPSGPALLRVAGSGCRVHLPVEPGAAPHPETGIREEPLDATQLAIVHDARFGELRALGRELQSALDTQRVGATFEFHSVDGDFVAGDVALALPQLPEQTPSVIALQGDAAPPPPISGLRILTVARQHGTGGEQIAARAAKELGLKLFDYEVFRRAAEHAGVKAEAVEGAARHRGFLARILDRMGTSYVGSGDAWLMPVPLRSSPLFTSSEYRAFVEDAVRELAEQGDALILGHGAQLVLAGRPDTLRVLVTGGIDHRIARAVAGGMDRDEAERVIQDADRERVDYFHEFYQEGWLNPATYDVVLNTDRLSFDECVRTIVELFARGRRPAPAPEPELARA